MELPSPIWVSKGRLVYIARIIEPVRADSGKINLNAGIHGTKIRWRRNLVTSEAVSRFADLAVATSLRLVHSTEGLT